MPIDFRNSETKDNLMEIPGSAKEKITETTGAAKDKIVETTGTAKDKIAGTTGAAKDKITGTTGAAKDKFADTAADLCWKKILWKLRAVLKLRKMPGLKNPKSGRKTAKDKRRNFPNFPKNMNIFLRRRTLVLSVL